MGYKSWCSSVAVGMEGKEKVEIIDIFTARYGGYMDYLSRR